MEEDGNVVAMREMTGEEVVDGGGGDDDVCFKDRHRTQRQTERGTK